MQSSKMRAFLKQTWRTLGAPFRSNDTEGSTRQSTTSAPFGCLLRVFTGHADCKRHKPDDKLRLLEEGSGGSLARGNDAHTQTPEWNTGYSSHGVRVESHVDRMEAVQPRSSPDSDNTRDRLNHALVEQLDSPEASNSSGNEEPIAQPDEENAGSVKFPDRDRVVAANGRIVFLLTKETVERLHQIKVASQRIKKLRGRFEEAEKEAFFGQSFIKLSEGEIDDPVVPEHIKMEVRKELEQRKPGILIDVQRKIDLETELNIQSADLEFLRAQSDGLFDQIIEDAGIIEESEEMLSEHASQTSETCRRVESVHSGLIDESGQEVGCQDSSKSEDPEKYIAEQEYHQAIHDLRTARDRFGLREETYRGDVARHANGLRFSREQIDLFHLQVSRDLTRDLREAEEEFERTLERAKAFGIETCSNASSECRSWYGGESHEGYRESEDPANTVVVDYEGIEAWIANFEVCEEERSPSPPDSIYEWEVRSAGISDSCSACAEDTKQRRRIDRWHKHQASLREARLGAEK